VAAIVTYYQGSGFPYALPIYIAAALSVLHTLVTTQAAPTNFRQRAHENDETALSAILDRFARLQALRAALQFLTFVVLLWALVAYQG